MSDLLDVAIDNSKQISRNLNSDLKLGVMTKELEAGVSKTLDKVANYIIKALPIPDCAKDILKDVKDALKTKDVKTILGTAIKSSIREGLELLGVSNKTIENVFKLKDVALKGGLSYNIKNSIAIASKDFLNNNLSSEYAQSFFYQLEKCIQSNKFIDKLEEVLKKSLKRKETFLEKVNEWYKCYENLDFDKMTNIVNNLKRKKDLLILYPECEKQYGIIKNITSMANSKKEKLSKRQLQLCSTL